MSACRRNRGTAQAADRYAAGGDHAAVRGRWGRATICAYRRYSRLGRNSALQEEMCSPGRMVAVCAGELRRRRDRAHHCAPRRRTSSSCTATGRSRACASSSRTGPGSPPPTLLVWGEQDVSLGHRKDADDGGYDMTGSDNSVAFSQLVLFVLDDDGLWRIKFL